MELKVLQKEIDDWIKTIGIRYFNELTKWELDKDKNDLNSEFLEMPFSKTAKIRATNSNFKDIGAFFQSVGID